MSATMAAIARRCPSPLQGLLLQSICKLVAKELQIKAQDPNKRIALLRFADAIFDSAQPVCPIDSLVLVVRGLREIRISPRSRATRLNELLALREACQQLMEDICDRDTAGIIIHKSGLVLELHDPLCLLNRPPEAIQWQHICRTLPESVVQIVNQALLGPWGTWRQIAVTGHGWSLDVSIKAYAGGAIILLTPQGELLF